MHKRHEGVSAIWRP